MKEDGMADSTTRAAMRVLSLCALLLCAAPTALLSYELSPATARAQAGGTIGSYSARTVEAAVFVDRDGASLIGFTLKDRPFERPLALPDPRPFAPSAGSVQVEIALLGPDDERYTQRLEVKGLCLEHGPDAESHIAGDTIRLHRESVIVEVPDLPGFDRIEIAYYQQKPGFAARAPLAILPLSADRFTAAAGKHHFVDLASATTTPAGPAPGKTGAPVPPAVQADGGSRLGAAAAPGGRAADQPLTTGKVTWPEEYGDPDPYLIYGVDDVSKRINIVIVPDGYTYAQKSTMLAHAQSLVNFLRAKTPYKEHDPFINYILVYAYSNQSGTDQCDCSIVVDTAMATRFPLITSTCGHTNNRCLFYGNGNGGPNCDPNVSTANVAAAELRAPARDATLIMVNTTRYGGCGGSRAVYAAGNGSATEIAAHELGHSLAGLADEYGGTAACGDTAGEVNTSIDSSNGAWPEWVPTIGAPREDAQYYSNCIYRPENSCEMRTLGPAFCRVCNQQWALTFFSHPHVFPTAPISDTSPASPAASQVGQVRTFSLLTRLAQGPAVTNSYQWSLQGPGYPSPTTVFTGGAVYPRSFALPGVYTLMATLTADTNFVKPSRYGLNQDTVQWTINASSVPEVSGGAIRELMVSRSTIDPANVDLQFEDVGSDHYNIYVSRSPSTAPFLVSDPSQGKEVCSASGVTSIGGGMNQISNFSLESGLTGAGDLLCILVTADNGSPTEGSLGNAANPPDQPAPRTADAYCGH